MLYNTLSREVSGDIVLVKVRDTFFWAIYVFWAIYTKKTLAVFFLRCQLQNSETSRETPEKPPEKTPWQFFLCLHV